VHAARSGRPADDEGELMLTRSVLALLLAAPLSLATVGCASNPFRPVTRVGRQPEALSSSHTDRLLQLAQRYEQQGNYEGALRLYHQAQKAEPGNSRVESSIAAITARQHQPGDWSAERQLADSRGTNHAPKQESSPTWMDRQADSTPQPAPERIASQSTAAADIPPSEEELPAVQPARESDWMFAAAGTAKEDIQHSDDDSSDEPVWWRATQAAANTEADAASGGWTPASWSASAEVATSDVDAVMGLLQSDSAEDRQDGLEELARLGPDATIALTQVQSLTHDSDPLVQAHAAWALWSITEEGFEAVPALTSLLESDEESVVQVSAYMLGSIGPAAVGSVEALNAVCDASDRETRLYAAEALSRITADSDDAVQILIAALTSPEPQSRWLAAISLAGVAPSHRDAAVAALITALDDADASVCSVAALTLGGFGPDAQLAVPRLEQVATSNVEDVRNAAQAALACIAR